MIERVVALGEVADHHRRLGLPVVLGEDRSEPLHGLGQPHRVDRRGAVVDRLERGQVPRVRVRVVHQGVEHRGHQHGGADLLLLDGPQHLGRVEARQHVERPALHHRRHEERCARVGERRTHQEARRLRPLPLGELHLRHRGHRLRGADDALRLPGGPTGVGDRHDVVWREQGCLERLRRELLGRCREVAPHVGELVGHRADGQHLGQSGHLLEQSHRPLHEHRHGVDDQRRDAGVVEDVGVVVERAERVQRRTPVALGLARHRG